MSAHNSNPTPRARELFLAALKLPAGLDRSAWLAQACGADSALRAHVQSLLDHHRDDDFLEHPAAVVPPAPLPAAEKPGDRIGRYKLLEQIGEGGMGIVWMAEQEEPVRRRVALKILKPGMDTQAVVARFEAERQALALMEHPNIARVFDGGATETGRPYFVMELVRGTRITGYCDEKALAAPERLALFIQVCQAVQHAHQKGVIHRDLKPSNILVTDNDGAPVPKVIDFGIAKATQQKLTEKTLFTAFGQFLGTPAYMSPEQAVMTSLDIDTRSDIYSLGVLLYELLTSTTPFDGKELLKSGFDEMRRIIREVEPPTPSKRVERLSQLRVESDGQRPAPASRPFNHQLSTINSDLDCLVMKCLEKDRNRRYSSAEGLAEDLTRWQRYEPIMARPTGPAERVLRWMRRHPLKVALGVAILCAIAGPLLVAAWYILRELPYHATVHTIIDDDLRGVVTLDLYDAKGERCTLNFTRRPFTAGKLMRLEFTDVPSEWIPRLRVQIYADQAGRLDPARSPVLTNGQTFRLQVDSFFDRAFYAAEVGWAVSNLLSVSPNAQIKLLPAPGQQPPPTPTPSP